MPGGATTTSAGKARCVVWHPRDRPPRPELVVALTRPGFRMFRCDNSFSAFAHACARTGPAAAAEDESTIMLLVEPTELEDASGFVEALSRYASSSIWVYESAGSPRLRGATRADLERWRVEAEKPAEPKLPAPSDGPRLRLSGEGALPPQRTACDEPETPSPVPDVKFRNVASSPAVARPEEASSAPAAPVVQNAPARPVQTLLTDEELAMLLAFEPEKRTS